MPQALDPRTAQIAHTRYHKTSAIASTGRTLHISRPTLHRHITTATGELA